MLLRLPYTEPFGAVGAEWAEDTREIQSRRVLRLLFSGLEIVFFQTIQSRQVLRLPFSGFAIVFFRKRGKKQRLVLPAGSVGAGAPRKL